MAILSDVHVTYSDVLGDFAVSRFKFEYGEICKEYKKIKTGMSEKMAGSTMNNTFTDFSKCNDNCLEESDNGGGFTKGKKRNNKLDVKKGIGLGKNRINQCEADTLVSDCDQDNLKHKTTGHLSEVLVEDEEKVDHFEYDSDGDLKIKRKRCQPDSQDENEEDSCLSITIKHRLATNLDAVGEQVWQGAFLLCDFICDQRSQLKGQCVVDLGAGTGLTSIVAAMFADHVFCTDTGDSVLQLATSNTSNARECLKLHKPLCPIDVKDLNWFTYVSGLKGDKSQPPTRFSLTSEDFMSIKGAEVLIAADVIYDDSITDAFFSTIKYLLTELPEKTLYIGLERRIVFTITDLDVTSPGYNHFMDRINRLVESSKTLPLKLTVEKIETNFRQFFQYDRSDYLELWKIASTVEKT